MGSKLLEKGFQPHTPYMTLYKPIDDPLFVLTLYKLPYNIHKRSVLE